MTSSSTVGTGWTTRIFRYEVPVDDKPHTIELSTSPLHVGCRHFATVEFWAIHHGGAKVPRTFQVVGTGHPLPSNFRRYVGTAVAPGGALVWHLIELAPAVPAQPSHAGFSINGRRPQADDGE